MTELKREEESLNRDKWKQADGFSRYFISDDGQIYSRKLKRNLPQGITASGYNQVDVYNDSGIKKHMKVHRLVYMAHKGPIPQGLEINHIDECKTNNCIENLEAVTHKQNMNHATCPLRIGVAHKKYPVEPTTIELEI